MTEGKWLLVCAGGWPREPIWRPLVEACERLIAVDGGAIELARRGLVADLIIGDLDSVTKADLEAHPEAEVIEVESQQESDLVKALAWCLANAATAVDVIGIEGGRPDHSFAAFAALAQVPAAALVTLHFNQGTARLLVADQSFACKPGDKISLFALGGPVNGVCLEGFEWPVTGEVLALSTRGLSNTTTGEVCRISHDKDSKGRLLCFMVEDDSAKD